MRAIQTKTSRNISSLDAGIRGAIGVVGFSMSFWHIGAIGAALPIALVSVGLLATTITRDCPLHSLLAKGLHRSPTDSARPHHLTVLQSSPTLLSFGDAATY